MKILIVDDEKEISESLLNIIKIRIDDTYEIIEAKDGLEALGLVDSFSPDIILTDIMMPNMDGIRLTSILKSQAQTKDIFVVAITGLSSEEDIQRIYASGVDFYISKPFKLDDIEARIKVITSLMNNKHGDISEKPEFTHNCFLDDDIKHYFTTFTIVKEDDIFLLFDYLSSKALRYNSLHLKDFMVTLVQAYRKIEVNKRFFDLIVEESEFYIYVTVKSSIFVEAMKHLLRTSKTFYQYKKEGENFSFKIEIFSLLDTEENQKNDEIHSASNETISARELVKIVSKDIVVDAKNLKILLKEYSTLCSKERVYTTELKHLLDNLLNTYVMLFKKLPNFDKIFIALKSVSIAIKLNKMTKFDKITNDIVIKHIRELNSNIENWIDNVIINKVSDNIHYNDYNIMSNCRLIEKDFN